MTRRTNATTGRTKRTRGKFYNPEKLTKEGLRSIGGEDSGMFQASAENRDVWRQAHRAGTLAYAGQVRHSMQGSAGFLSLLPASDSGEQGMAVQDGGDVQNYQVEANGYCACRFVATGAGQWENTGVNYGPFSILQAVPSSITFFSFTGSSFVNIADFAAHDISERGFSFNIQSAAAGQTEMSAWFTTNGAF